MMPSPQPHDNTQADRPPASDLKSYYFHVETGLFAREDWTPPMRCVFLALLKLAAELGGTGAFRLHIEDVQDTISASDFDAKSPTLSKISAVLQALSSLGHVKLLSKRWVFLRGFWEYGRSISNEKQRRGLLKSLVSMPPDVQRAFAERYFPDGAESPIAYLKDYPIDRDSKRESQKQSQKQKQKQEDKTAPAGGQAAAAQPARRRGGKPKAEIDSQPWKDCADYLFRFVEQAQSKGYEAEPWSAPSLATAMAKSAVHPDKLKAALTWGMSDRYWQKELLRHAPFANGAKFKKLVNDSQSAQQAKPVPDPNPCREYIGMDQNGEAVYR